MIEDLYATRNLALAFAARAHRHQVRKGTARLQDENLKDVDALLGASVPYLTHPVAVGMLLLEHGAPDTVVVSGILHDVLEDTAVTAELLERTFGAEVTRLVVAASEPDKELPWRERKQHTLDQLAATDDVDVKLVVAADKLHNVQSIQLDVGRFGEGAWDRFNAPKDSQAWYYYGVCRALSAKGVQHNLFRLLEQAVSATFAGGSATSPSVTRS